MREQGSGMRVFTFHLSHATLTRLREEALRKESSVSGIIREAIYIYLRAQEADIPVSIAGKAVYPPRSAEGQSDIKSIVKKYFLLPAMERGDIDESVLEEFDYLELPTNIGRKPLPERDFEQEYREKLAELEKKLTSLEGRVGGDSQPGDK